MKQYHIGLDFGTYQSKACIYHIDRDEHEFFRFDNGSFFLLSRVAIKKDGTLEYGDKMGAETLEEYYYFKIAAAEDEEFHAETYGKEADKDVNFYKFNEFHNYTPEFLSVVYLTNILFVVKEHYQSPTQPQKERRGLISRFLGREKQQIEEVRFTVQLGIPTEWSQAKNLKRKRKFENILMLATLLQKKYLTLSAFLSASANQLKNDLKEAYESNSFESKEKFYSQLHELGLSIYPETAAGITFLLLTNQLLPGYYAAMDIGAGSTDVSFYQILGNNIKYIASESYILASNDLYRIYSGSDNSMRALKTAEDNVKLKISTDDWKKDLHLVDSLKKLDHQLEDKLYRLFNKRVYYFSKGMLTNYLNQPIIMYGGGALIPIINSGQFLLHDHGSPSSITIPRTYVEKNMIERYSAILNILPGDESWKPFFPLLVVALGLSFIKADSAAEWFDDTDYHIRDGAPELVPHPFNEDLFIYDVLLSKFR